MADSFDKRSISTISNDLSDEIDLDFEGIDDAEYEIPQCEVPTLESILNEAESESLLPDDELLSSTLAMRLRPSPLPFFKDLTGTDNMSIASDSSVNTAKESTLKQQHDGALHKRIEETYLNMDNLHGSIIWRVVLRGISAQLISAAERVNAGTPTAMIAANLIAVGTSHGLVLVFDPKQALKCCLGNTGIGEQYGSVSALGFNRFASRLLVGFARGQICMWDVDNAKLLRTILDAHTIGAAVLHIKFTDDSTLAVCSDSGGSVFELNFSRVMGVRSCYSRCLFSGSRGEVCAIAPLVTSVLAKEHALKDIALVAMATLSKVIVVMIRPKMKVVFSHALVGISTCLPVISWQFVGIQITKSSKVVDPVFTFARENSVYFFQVSATAHKHKVLFVPLQKLVLDYEILNFQWLNSRVVSVLDSMERLHIIDVRTREDLETIDLTDMQMLYGSSHFKGLATGGNVSKAMALVGERACYHSFNCYNGQLVVLGMKCMHIMTIRPWNKRIDDRIKRSRYVEALELTLAFYTDTARAAVGLPTRPEKRQAVLSEKLLSVLNLFLAAFMELVLINSESDQILHEQILFSVACCLKYCFALGRVDLVFERLYAAFEADYSTKTAFLDNVEPYIMSGDLTDMPPAIMQEFVERMEDCGRFESLEACVIRLDVMNMDIHQILTICWAHSLYDAILYMYNRATGQYMLPLQELLTVLQNALRTKRQLTDDQINLGNKLLVYISCCLAGRAYPSGSIQESQVDLVKDEVLRCITLTHTKDATDDEPVHPYLRTLLHFDTKEFLNVLSLAFEEPGFSNEVDMRHRQRLVDILLQIMVDSEDFSPNQVGALFTFLARQIAKQENSIMVNRMLFEQVLEYLTVSSDVHGRPEREQALIELLNAGGMQHYNENQLLDRAEKANFFRVCEMVYENRRDFRSVLSCYLRDDVRKDHVFSCVRKLFSEQALTPVEKRDIQTDIMNNVSAYVAADSRETAKLFIEFFHSDITPLLQRADVSLRSQYELLKALDQLRSKSDEVKEGEFAFDSHTHTKYIERMCQFEPFAVYPYLRSNDNYDLMQIKRIIEKYEVHNCIPYLLEKCGDFQGAFQITYKALERRCGSIIDELRVSGTNGLTSNCDMAFAAWRAELEGAVALCQRCPNAVESAVREKMWFDVLDITVLPFKQVSVSNDHQSVLKALTSIVMAGMMGFVQLTSLMHKILSDSSYNIRRLADIREFLHNMTENYHYEKIMLETTNRVMESTVHDVLSNLKRASNRGLSCRGELCSFCGKWLDSADTVSLNQLIVFKCGHAFHVKCMEKETSCEPSLNKLGEQSTSRSVVAVCRVCQVGSATDRKLTCMVEVGGGKESKDDQTTSISQVAVNVDRYFQTLTHLKQHFSPSRQKSGYGNLKPLVNSNSVTSKTFSTKTPVETTAGPGDNPDFSLKLGSICKTQFVHEF